MSEKQANYKNYENANYGIHCYTYQGYPDYMEDRVSVSIKDDCTYIGLFDGHGGNFASEYTSKNLHDRLIFDTDKEQSIKRCFILMDNELRALNKDTDPGTTALIATIFETQVFIGNAGDSRAMISNNGQVKQITIDHEPTRDVELRRIRNAGFVVIDGKICHNDGTVIKVARSLGDFKFKDNKTEPHRQAVSPVPEIFKFDITDSLDVLILVSDGISECLTSKEIVSYIYNQLSIDMNVEKACISLCDYCYGFNAKLGYDNMSLIMLFFYQTRNKDELFNHIKETYNSKNIEKWVDKKIQNIDIDEEEYDSSLIINEEDYKEQ